MAVASILVVDGDADARAVIAASLRKLGHDVNEAANASSALAAVRTRQPDLVVCDCALPDLDGVELLSDIRSDDRLRSMRVLMTSDRSASDDAASAIKAGADDFAGKPINMPEFIARVDACLSRPAKVSHSPVISAGGITVDNISHRVTADAVGVALAPREYTLLLFMITNRDRVFSRKQLLMQVWDRDALVGPRTVDVHIRRLRSLLQKYGYDKYVQTVRGSGYRFSLHV